MVAACALCKSKNPHRTHVFPQNSRAEVQLKWMKALGLPKDQEDAVLAEMRQIEQKGNRPRWCSFHFEYDSAGIHFPKYFDPEEGKTAQGWKEDDEHEDDDEEEGEGPSTKGDEAETSRDGSGTPTEPRRSTRKRAAPSTPAAPIIESPEKPGQVSPSELPEITDPAIRKLLLSAGITLPGPKKKEVIPQSTPSTSKRGGETATAVEKTLQDILMGAGLPVPDSLQAKTGVLVDEGEEDSEDRVTQTRRTPRQMSTASALKKGSITVAEAKRLGTYVPGTSRAGGATLSSPKTLMNPIAAKYSNDWPKVIMPKAAPKLQTTCYNHNTMEKYDDSDALSNFKMPCKKTDCRSELTVIMNRARALEEQFDDLTSSVLHLTQMYKTKTPQAYRPTQSLATIQGRAAAVAGPVYGVQSVHFDKRVIPVDSLSVQERRMKKLELSQKEPQRLLTDDDLARTVRRKMAGKGQSSAEEDDEEDEDAPDLEDDDSAPDDEWKPSSHKRRRLTSARDVDTSASEATPPRLEMEEDS